MTKHVRACDCDDCWAARHPQLCRVCTDELTAEAVSEMDATICEHCKSTECPYCGLQEIDLDLNDAGDRVCIHCRNGHQRVLYRHDEALHVQGPCRCEVA